MTVLSAGDANMNPGAVLANAREAAGLSVAAVAAQLRLSPRQIEALEADRYCDLPGAVFVRGFIRNYARMLKLDPVPLLHALEPALDEEAPLRVRETSGALPLSARRGPARPLLFLFCAIVIVVMTAGGYELWSRQKEQKSEAVAESTDARAAQSTEKPAENVQQPTPTVATTTEAPVEIVPQEPAAIESPRAAAPKPSVQQGAAKSRIARLRVQFNADSWLEVREHDGGLIYSGTGQAGSERVVEAVAPLSVVIGNANGVRITYNDQALDLSAYAARNIARLTLE